ncbi:MAG TPA: hypothetical protein VK998_11170, partial [Schnuerera sp.]|nr:hypothetical protein [Schnuerera sp.]
MLKTEYVSTKKKIQNRIITFNWGYILLVILAFFISRASIIDKLTPFGLTFMAAYILSGKPNILIFISIILGTLSFHGLSGIDYIVSTVAIWILLNRVKQISAFSSAKSSIITGSIFILTKSVFLLIFESVFIYDLFIIFFEGLLVFTLTYIFLYSLSVETIG